MGTKGGRVGRMEIGGSGCHYYINGAEVTREEWDAAFPSKLGALFESGETLTGRSSSAWPMHSEAFAVHPDQVDAANDRNRKHGIAARYERGTGVCEIDSEADKVKLCKLEGFLNKQAGYRG